MKKQVIITGANGGIGSALCKAYFKNDFEVIALDKQPAIEHSYGHQYISIDSNAYASSEEYRDNANIKLKSLNPSILINNAATQLLGNFESFEDKSWITSMNVNFHSCYFFIQAFYASLSANVGQVINIGSIHAAQAKPRFFAYATSKSALVGLTKSLAVEFKGKITVNAVSPAAIGTDMLKAGFDNNEAALDKLAEIHPSQQIGEPDLLASFIMSLTTANNRFLNGSNISYDGGISNALLDLDY